VPENAQESFTFKLYAKKHTLRTMRRRNGNSIKTEFHLLKEILYIFKLLKLKINKSKEVF